MPRHIALIEHMESGSPDGTSLLSGRHIILQMYGQLRVSLALTDACQGLEKLELQSADPWAGLYSVICCLHEKTTLIFAVRAGEIRCGLHMCLVTLCCNPTDATFDSDLGILGLR